MTIKITNSGSVIDPTNFQRLIYLTVIIPEQEIDRYIGTEAIMLKYEIIQRFTEIKRDHLK